MSGKLLLFGFDSLLHVLALEAAVGPFGAEIVPVARSGVPEGGADALQPELERPEVV